MTLPKLQTLIDGKFKEVVKAVGENFEKELICMLS